MKKVKKLSCFDIINTFLMLLVIIVCAYPFLYELAIALSDGKAVSAGKVFLFPKDFNWHSFNYILKTERLGILRGFINSVFYTTVGTVVSVMTTFTTAYVLSRKKFRMHKIIIAVFMFTYVFEAGLIPNYLINNNLHLVNNVLIMILPSAISTYLLIITRTFLLQIPDALEESATLDGANDFQIMWHIFFPISKPAVATIALFYAVQRWNDFLIPLIYLKEKKLQPLSLILYNFTVAANSTASPLENIQVNGVLLSYRTLTAAIVIITIVPILLVYPFAQKYFASGLLMGSVKE